MLRGCVILVPRPGMGPGPTVMKAPSPNHWTTREFPQLFNVLLYERKLNEHSKATRLEPEHYQFGI